jgi:type I restriction enzyme S subunit
MTALRKVALREVVEPVVRAVTPLPGQNYRQLGVRLWGQGGYEREPLDGSQTKYRQIFRAEEGDIVVNKIWARNGSVAVVERELSGCHGSSEFPMFSPFARLLDPRWMHWVCRTRGFWEQCQQKSQGTSGQNRIRPEEFLEVEIPLPSLEEQHRIVARIETVATKIQEALDLRRQASIGSDALLRAILFGDKGAVLVPMAELVRLRAPDVVVQASETYRFAGVYSFGRGVFRGLERQGMEFAYPRLSRLRAGDFVYPKLMAWEGALGVVPDECDGLLVSTEFPVFEVNRERVFPEVLDVYFRTPSVWPKLSGASTGTNVRRRRLNPADFLRHRMPLPNVATQARLRDAKQRIDSVKRLHAETAKELDAMVPAVLDKAFRGEL